MSLLFPHSHLMIKSKCFHPSSIVRKEFSCFENSFIPIRDFDFSYLEYKQCKQYTYKLQATSTAQQDSYTCNDNPNNLASGYCILSFPDALKQCDQDPNCGGFGITTNQEWHQAFDRNGLPTIELFSINAQPVYNVEWTSFVKDDSN